MTADRSNVPAQGAEIPQNEKSLVNSCDFDIAFPGMLILSASGVVLGLCFAVLQQNGSGHRRRRLQLRLSPFPKPALAVLYIGIGGGLFLSSLA